MTKNEENPQFQKGTKVEVAEGHPLHGEALWFMEYRVYYFGRFAVLRNVEGECFVVSPSLVSVKEKK